MLADVTKTIYWCWCEAVPERTKERGRNILWTQSAQYQAVTMYSNTWAVVPGAGPSHCPYLGRAVPAMRWTGGGHTRETVVLILDCSRVSLWVVLGTAETYWVHKCRQVGNFLLQDPWIWYAYIHDSTLPGWPAFSLLVGRNERKNTRGRVELTYKLDKLSKPIKLFV